MTRATFLKNLIGLYGVSSIPLAMVKQYQKVYLLQCFVRGFTYYEGPKMINELNTSGLLQMVREPDNEYDPCAIALHFNSKKIGFIPMESNEVLSVLIDTKLLNLQAEITHIEPNAQTWENVFVAIYAMTEIDNQASQELIAPYTMLDSPEYYTLKSSNNTYTRIYYDEEVISETYEYSNKNDVLNNVSEYELPENINQIFAQSDEEKIELEAAASESRIVIQSKQIPRNLSIIEVGEKLNNELINIQDTFQEDGYIVANMDKIGAFPDKISKFIKIFDKNGKQFYELIFKK